jgi:trimeric autotransporter adhesin
MSSPGTLRFGQVAVKPSAPPVGYDLIYVKTDDVLYIQDSAGVEVALGSASAITSLSGEATGSGPGNAVVTLSNSAVIGKVLTGFTPGPNSPVLATDTILQAFEKLQGQFNASAGNAITALTGDVSAAGPGSVPATVNSVGGKTASDIALAVTTVDAATSSNTASTLVERDASGNFAANIITASLNGNAATSINFTGSLSGDITGTQNATVVQKIQGYAVNPTPPPDASILIYDTVYNQWIPFVLSGDIVMNDVGVTTVNSVGGKSASSIATSVNATQAGTSADTPNTLVLRDGSGNFSAGTITANLTGNVSGSSSTFTGSLSGDITGTQSATVLSATTNSTLTTLSALSLLGSQVTGNISGNAANVTGIIAITHGGTGQTTANAGFDALSPMTTAGDLVYENNTPTAARLPIGSTGEVLTVSGGLPTWAFPATSGTVTSVALADGSSTPIYAITGSPVTSSGTLTFTLDNQPANEVFAGPTSGPAAQPTFRSLVSADIPNNAANTTGTASNITATSNSTLTTLPNLSLPGSQVTGNISGNAGNVTGVVAIVNGGTGQTTANAAFNALSPMTTLGDIIYENATPAAARLPGNTTNTREFLTSQGSGGLATAPTWSALVSGDIPNNAANTTGTASNITATTNTTLTSLPNLTSATSLSITGSQVGGFTQGSVIFAGASGQLTQDNSLFYWDDTNHALGIGTIPAATAVLDIINNSGATKAIQVTGYGSNVGFRGREAGGTLSSPTATPSGTTLTFFSGRGYGTTGFAAAGTGVVNIIADATFTDTSMPTHIGFNVTPVGSVTSAEAMRIAPTGDVLIGTTTDSGTQKLQVNGNSNVGTVTGGTWNSTDIGVAYGGTGISTIPTNGQLLIGNGTGYTVANLTAGTGISIANAAGSITVTANNTTSFVTKTANYTILSTDGTIFCDTSGGAFTLTLPSPTGLGGKLYRIIDSTGFFQSNNLTLAPSASEKIEGLAASKVLQTPWGWFTVTTDGTNWFVG